MEPFIDIPTLSLESVCTLLTLSLRGAPDIAI
jgi:hypothetical protein